MFLFLIIVVVFAVMIYLFTGSTPFGALSTGDRLERIKKSPQYDGRRFKNLHLTPNLAEGVSYTKVMCDFFFGRDKRNRPDRNIPSVRTDLCGLDPAKDLLVWFGHSSYFLQVDGKRILVDPVFSGSASPVWFTTRSYEGSNMYGVEEMPAIDYLVITHDHWDHLDHRTVIALQPKVRQVITGMGTGAHLERWGFAPGIIKELDWQEEYIPHAGFVFTALPARHFSGRGFTRDQSLWLSLAVRTPTYHLYLGGDSGYDDHFAGIGRQYGPFDLAILECGQYNLYWPLIHMQPEQVVKAAKDLQAKKLLPVHWGKFSLGLHAWDEPIKRVTAEAERQHQPVIHPLIGEEVPLDADKTWRRWWEQV